jgi:serine protease AprX
MARLAERLERLLEAAPRTRIFPVIVESTRAPELFRYFTESLGRSFPALGLLRELRSRIQLDVEGLASLFYPRLIGMFNMFALPATADILEDMAQSREVVKVYPNRIVSVLEIPTVPEEGVYTDERGRKFTTTYWTSKILGADRAHEKGYWGDRLPNPLAVIDTTAAPMHDSIRRASFATTFPGIYTDGNGHGVWCAAAAAGEGWIAQHNLRTVGVAPRARLLTIKSLGFVAGYGTDSSVIEGIAQAVTRNAKVVSMSLGSDEAPENPEDDPEVKIIEALSQKGMIFCVAAGNSGPGSGTINSPGIAESAITVGSYSPITGQVSRFSSRGPTPDGRVKPDVIAPGENIFGPTVGLLDYAVKPYRILRASILSGTSMSTPAVAGIVHLIAESAYVNGVNVTAETIKDVMRNYGDYAKNNETGWGVLTWDKWERYAAEVLGINV